MSKFRLRAYYNEVIVFESSSLDYPDVISKLNDTVDMIYDFNYIFGDLVFKTSGFSYVIEEVE